MTRLLYLLFGATLLAASASGQEFDAFEKSIRELQEAMANGRVTSRQLVAQYLERIERFDRSAPHLNAFILVNPRALEQAKALDAERRQSGTRGPLHGIPILLKDNYDTVDMATTAGTVALAGHVPPDDGYQVRRLREAGAVFMGKTNLHELARGITTISSLGGQTLNPYDPSRSPGGSSGGTGAAVAANMAAVGMGSDTCGSIRIPSANNNLFGLRVTQGLSSRDGIIPLSHTQDVGGPLARSMEDLVIVLDTTVGPDPADSQTADSGAHIPATYTAFLRGDGLEGKRLGLLLPYLSDEAPNKEITELVRASVDAMKSVGAEAVDVDFDELEELLEGAGVINHEFKFDLNAYLDASGAPVNSLTTIIERGLYHEALSERFLASDQVVAGSDEYQASLAKRETVRSAILALMDSHQLDAIVYPTLREKPSRIGDPQRGGTCSVSATSGLPAISVPAGFTEDGVPIGTELLGRRYAEPELIAMAYAYEQQAKPRRPPARTPSLVSGALEARFEFFASSSQLTPPMSSETTARGELVLDRPGQRIRYEIRLRGIEQEDYRGARLHRKGPNGSGPVVALLGLATSGELSLDNPTRDALEAGALYIVLSTRSHPGGALRGDLTQRP